MAFDVSEYRTGYSLGVGGVTLREDRVLVVHRAPGSGAGDGYGRFMELAERLHKLSDDFFFWRSVGGLKDMFDPRRSMSIAMLKDVRRMRPGHSVAGTVRSFVPDSRAAQMLDHYTQYVGSCPDASPAVLCGIAHMQSQDGVWYPRGGTGAARKGQGPRIRPPLQFLR